MQHAARGRSCNGHATVAVQWQASHCMVHARSSQKPVTGVQSASQQIAAGKLLCHSLEVRKQHHTLLLSCCCCFGITSSISGSCHSCCHDQCCSILIPPIWQKHVVWLATRACCVLLALTPHTHTLHTSVTSRTAFEDSKTSGQSYFLGFEVATVLCTWS